MNFSVFIIFTLALTIYSLPLFVALLKEHDNTFAIFIFSFIFGWTIIGWLIGWAVVLFCQNKKITRRDYIEHFINESYAHLCCSIDKYINDNNIELSKAEINAQISVSYGADNQKNILDKDRT